MVSSESESRAASSCPPGIWEVLWSPSMMPVAGKPVNDPRGLGTWRLAWAGAKSKASDTSAKRRKRSDCRRPAGSRSASYTGEAGNRPSGVAPVSWSLFGNVGKEASNAENHTDHTQPSIGARSLKDLTRELEPSVESIQTGATRHRRARRRIDQH